MIVRVSNAEAGSASLKLTEDRPKCPHFGKDCFQPSIFSGKLLLIIREGNAFQPFFLQSFSAKLVSVFQLLLCVCVYFVTFDQMNELRN